jgi:peptide chain release factor 3
VQIQLTGTPYYAARWLPSNELIIQKLKQAYSTDVTSDIDGNPIALFHSAYALSQAEESVGVENLLKFRT